MRQLDRFALLPAQWGHLTNSQGVRGLRVSRCFQHPIQLLTVDLSSLYLDILKDRLYVEKTDGKMRRSAQSALYQILSALVRLMAPILVFTAEEVLGGVWQRAGGHHTCVLRFLNRFRALTSPQEERARWDFVSALRQDVAKALEEARRPK